MAPRGCGPSEAGERDAAMQRVTRGIEIPENIAASGFEPIERTR